MEDTPIDKNPETEKAREELSKLLDDANFKPSLDVLEEQVRPTPPTFVPLETRREVSNFLDTLSSAQPGQISLHRERPRVNQEVVPIRKIMGGSDKPYKVPEGNSISENNQAGEVKYQSVEDAVEGHLKEGSSMDKEGLITLIMGERNKIQHDDRLSRTEIGHKIQDLITEGVIIKKPDGTLTSQKFSGESGEVVTQSFKDSIEFQAFETEFSNILSARHEPTGRRGLLSFHQFDMELAKNPDDLLNRLSEAKKRGVFTPDEFKVLSGVLNNQKPEELPYSSGYIPEPPPVYEAPTSVEVKAEEQPQETQPEPPPVYVPPVEPPPFPESKNSVGYKEVFPRPSESRGDFTDPQFIEQKSTWQVPDRTITPKVTEPIPKVENPKIDIYHSLADYIESLSKKAKSPALFKSVAFSIRQDGISEDKKNSILKQFFNTISLSPEQKQKIEDIFSGTTGEYIDSQVDAQPEPPPFLETKVETNEEHEDSFEKEQLRSAREQYATFEAAYKKKIKEGRGWYEKTMRALGAQGKAYPIPEKDPEHKAAEEAYFRAKWNFKNSLVKDVEEIPFEYSNSFIHKEDIRTRKVDRGATKFSEEERRLLQRLVEEASTMPAKEKGAARKTMEKLLSKYNKLSPAARVGFSTTLIMGGTFLTGGIALGAVAGAGAVRAARGLAGLGAAGVVGEAFDGVKRKKQEKISAERREQYSEEIAKIAGDDESAYQKFKELEEVQVDLDEKEAQQDKRDRLIKAALMAATGGAAALATGAVIDTVAPSGTGASTLDTKKPTFLDKLLRKTPETQASVPTVEAPQGSAVPEVPKTPPVVETPPVALNIEGQVNVPLSSKGYIATIAELQEQLKGKPLSPKLAELLKEPPEKIAIKLGLYKPDEAAESALGFKGNQLTLDTEGNISLMHNDASVDTLVKSDGTVLGYKGEMFDADGLSPVETETTSPVPETPEPSVEDNKIAETASTTTRTVPAVETFDGAEYASPSPEYRKPDDITKGLYPLKKEYQFGTQYEPQRKAYNMLVRKQLMYLAPEAVDSKLAFAYQKGGMIDVFQKGDEITVLLNGEKIGTGLIISEGRIGFQYENKLGKSMLGVKSDYEQAFDYAKGEIEKNKKSFKVTK